MMSLRGMRWVGMEEGGGGASLLATRRQSVPVLPWPLHPLPRPGRKQSSMTCCPISAPFPLPPSTHAHPLRRSGSQHYMPLYAIDPAPCMRLHLHVT